VKWFRMDSDTPNHPTSRRVIRKLGNEGFGALVRLWCFAAQYGKSEPGRCVDSDGDPVQVEDLVDASGLTDEKFRELVVVLLETKCIDAEAWESRQEMAYPGMTTRADEYTKKVRRNSVVKGQPLFGDDTDKIQKTLPRVQESTEEHSTEDKTWRPLPQHRLPSQGERDGRNVMTWWNEITHPPIPRCNGLNARRTAACRRVFDEFDEEKIKEAFAMINASKFCRGENDRGWKASFDWIIRPDSILRTLEGKYTDRSKVGTTRSESGKYDNVERGAS
jgi:hypothetical protein